MQYVMKQQHLLFVTLFITVGFVSVALPVHAYDLKTQNAQAAAPSATTTTAQATSSDATKIMGDVTEQEFAALLSDADVITDKTLAKAAVAGTVLAVGPSAKGNLVMLIELASGSTTAIRLDTKALFVRDDGTAVVVGDLEPGDVVIVAPADALLSQGTIVGFQNDVLTVTKSDGSSITLGTSSKALYERESTAVRPSEFVPGDSAVVVETATPKNGTSTVLAIVTPKAPPVVEEPVATTTEVATTTPAPTDQNNMFLWIIIGIAVVVLILGYFLMRRGSSQNNY